MLHLIYESSPSLPVTPCWCTGRQPNIFRVICPVLFFKCISSCSPSQWYQPQGQVAKCLLVSPFCAFHFGRHICVFFCFVHSDTDANFPSGKEGCQRCGFLSGLTLLRVLLIRNEDPSFPMAEFSVI